MNKNVLIIALIFVAGIANAQKIKLKKDIVYLDGNEVFKYEKRNWNTELLLYPIGADDEVIFIEYNNNETRDYTDDDFIKIDFVDQNLKMESNSKIGTWKFILKWMVQNKVFDKDGNLNAERIEKFVDRYDENITNRTVRNN